MIDDGASNDKTDSDDWNDDADECTFHYDSDTGAPHDAPVLLWPMLLVHVVTFVAFCCFVEINLIFVFDWRL